jgi:hypothetical protein
LRQAVSEISATPLSTPQTTKGKVVQMVGQQTPQQIGRILEFTAAAKGS